MTGSGTAGRRGDRPTASPRVGVRGVRARDRRVEPTEVERVLRAEALELLGSSSSSSSSTACRTPRRLRRSSSRAAVSSCGSGVGSAVLDGGVVGRSVARRPWKSNTTSRTAARCRRATGSSGDLGLRQPACLVLVGDHGALRRVERPAGLVVDVVDREPREHDPRPGRVAGGVPRERAEVDAARGEPVGHEVAQRRCADVAADARAAGLLGDVLALGEDRALVAAHVLDREAGLRRRPPAWSRRRGCGTGSPAGSASPRSRRAAARAAGGRGARPRAAARRCGRGSVRRPGPPGRGAPRPRADRPARAHPSDLPVPRHEPAIRSAADGAHPGRCAARSAHREPRARSACPRRCDDAARGHGHPPRARARGDRRVRRRACPGRWPAVRKQFDVFGILVLGWAAGLGGGLLRDVLIGAVPPVGISDWRLVATALRRRASSCTSSTRASSGRDGPSWCSTPARSRCSPSWARSRGSSTARRSSPRSSSASSPGWAGECCATCSRARSPWCCTTASCTRSPRCSARRRSPLLWQDELQHRDERQRRGRRSSRCASLALRFQLEAPGPWRRRPAADRMGAVNPVHPTRSGALVDVAGRSPAKPGALIRDGRAGTCPVAATKSSAQDVVTAMDLAVEALPARAAGRAAARRRGSSGRRGVRARARPGVTWVVDPIDGTVNYLYGLPSYSVSVAAVVGPPDPADLDGARRVRLRAGRRPDVHRRPRARRDARRAAVLRSRGAIAARQPRRDGLRIPRPGVRAQARSWPSCCRGYVTFVASDRPRSTCARVASGGLDLYYERGLQPWDLAAGALVAQEAGAQVTGLRGHRRGAR